LLKSPSVYCDLITLDGVGGTIAAVISIARKSKFEFSAALAIL
jgi:hypothetical protein